MEFETKKIIVKKFIPEYIGVLYDAWGNDSDVLKYLPEYNIKWTIDEFAEFMMRKYRDESDTEAVILNKETHKVIGLISLYQEDSRSKSVNIIINKDSWGCNYGTSALKGVIKEVKKMKVECIYATCDGRNEGAIKMCEKCGFELIDKIDNYRVDLNGSLGSEYLYELEL